MSQALPVVLSVAEASRFLCPLLPLAPPLGTRRNGPVRLIGLCAVGPLCRMPPPQRPASPPQQDDNRLRASTGLTRSSRSIFSRSLTFRSRHASEPAASSSTTGGPGSSRPAPESAKGPYGLTKLHSPPTDGTITAHIIFVHGLGGGSEHTWTHGAVFWPRDLLPALDTFHSTAIFSFGYNSDFTKSSILNLNDFSKSLLARMRNEPLILDAQCPVLLVGHSMGGLVVKRAYAIAKQLPDYASFAARIRGIFFIATPQSGSDLAPTLGRLFRLSSGLKPFLRDLQKNSDVVQNINVEFGVHSRDLMLYSFYESRKLNVSGLREVLIVSKQDAVLNYPNEQSQLLNGDHRSICKFASASDTNFIALWQTMAACLRAFQPTHSDKPASIIEPQPKHHDIDELSMYLGVREAPADDLQRIGDERLPGTCEWLLRNDAFKEWQDPAATKILWLRGPPGSGKSFVAGFAIDHFGATREKVCYYFFTHGDKVKSGLEGFLLSMTLQMAMIYPAILSKILHICRKDQDIGKAECRVLLRKLWEQCILTTPLGIPVIWVIDALDECHQAGELARLLTRVQEKGKGFVKIFLTTRNPATDYFISPDRILHTDAKTEDIQADIAAYLNAHLEDIPGSTTSERNAMRTRILQNSNGCFLWAILVLRRIRKIPGSKARLRTLDELQPGMEELYSRIVRSISERDRYLSMFILTWVTASVRALTVEELRFVLEQYASDEIESVEDLVSTNCHDLVYIDNKQRVRMRHDSARSFLLRKDINDEYDHDLTIQEEAAHKTLAMACLGYLNGAEMKGKQMQKRRRRVGQVERSAFVFYASRAVLEHINKISAADKDVVAGLATFLRTNVLTWIEHLARARDLETVLKMAQVLKVFLRRKSKTELLLGDDVIVIDNWATDLVKLVSKFGQQLLTYPESILYLIPPFCPTESAPYAQFAGGPAMAVSVHGLPDTVWDDLLCTVELTPRDGALSSGSGAGLRRERLHCIASSERHFCIGTSVGRIAVFNEKTCIQERSLDHGADLHPRECGVLHMQFATSKPLLASVSKRLIRIWNTTTWEPQWDVRLPADCLTLTFVDDDCGLLLALVNNELWDLDLIDRRAEDPIKWTDKMDGLLAAYFRGSYPWHAAFNPDLNLLAIAYRNHDVLVWNYEHNSYHIYNPDAGGRCEPTTQSFLSIDALVFSRLPDTSLLAVEYTTSDVVIYDTVPGTIKAKTSNVYVTKLMSSPDGKTLAAARRDGAIELYDFENLHRLCRIAPVDGAVSALAFSVDSTRLLDIRAGGRTCRMWDPSALFRRDVGHDSVRTPSTYSSESAEKTADEDADAVVEISALACDGTGDFFFVGKDDATVSVYDVRTGQAVSELFSHKASTKSLYYDAMHSILVSVDTAGVLMVHRIRQPGPRTNAGWETELVFTRRSRGVSVQQVLCHKDMGRLLICADGKTSLFSLLSSGDEDHPLAVVDNGDNADDSSVSSRICWAQHPSDPTLLLFLSPSEFHIYTWEGFQRVSPPQGLSIFGDGLPPDLRLTDAKALCNGQLLGLIALPTAQGAARGTTYFICVPAAELSEEPSADFPDSAPSAIECFCVVGEWRERLVFLNSDGWICSIRAATLLRGGAGEGVDEEVLHHFPPPTEWLRKNRELLVQVTRRGDVLFVVQGKVAVVRNGLDKSFDV